MGANYRLVATQVGDLVKWNTSVNEIGRAASAILGISKDSFPNDSITSVRAQLVHDWVLSLARTEMGAEERDRRLVQFCRAIITKDQSEALETILRDAGVGAGAVDQARRAAFDARGFHAEVVRHSQRLFLQGNYFHAVFESAKVYNKLVREKAQNDKDGEALMFEVWGCEKGVLKVTRCETETDRNVQDGIKFLSAGLMRAIRNPTAHEPAVDWPISQEDCLDVLSFLSPGGAPMHRGAHQQGALSCWRVPHRPAGVLVATVSGFSRRGHFGGVYKPTAPMHRGRGYHFR